jgi:uncharacterized membrane protein
MSDEILRLVMRWLHVIAAIVAVGGSTFLRLVLMPVAGKVLADEEHERLRQPLMRRWKIFVHTSIFLFLVSGFYNYLVVTLPEHSGQPLYHMGMGIKILLAVVVIVLAIGLTSRFGWSAALRAKPARWLGVLLLCAYLIVLIAGALRMMGPVPSG